MKRTCLATLLCHSPVLTMLVISLCGCQAEDTDKAKRLKMAHVYEVSAPTHEYGAAHLAERLQAVTSELNVTVYPAAKPSYWNSWWQANWTWQYPVPRSWPCGIRHWES